MANWKKILLNVRQLNIWKTIILNFRAFPFCVAIKMPVWVFGKLTILHVYRGCIELAQIKSGLLRLGWDDRSKFNGKYVTSVYVSGTIKVDGYSVIRNGSTISVSEGAVLEIGRWVNIGVCNKLFCEKRMVIGERTITSWECQFMDTDFHIYREDGIEKENSGDIMIGERCWIGSRVTVLKNSILPGNSIVASNSLVNKDLSKNESGGLYAGIPAKLLKTNCYRLDD